MLGVKRDWILLDEICVIDDASIPRTVTQRICENYFKGVPVRCFVNPDDAINYLRMFVGKKRVIFVDLHMPIKDGWTFLEEYIPGPLETIYILSNSESSDDKDRAKQLPHVKEFLQKPITVESLSVVYDSVLE